MDDPLSKTDLQSDHRHWALVAEAGDGQADGDGRSAPTYEELALEVANLRAALESRTVIDMAKGILIARVGCDPDRAFELLVAQSQHENRKVRDLAAELLSRNVRTG